MDPATLKQVACVGKQCFPTKAAALKIARSLKWRANVYRCRICDGFHIGHSK